MKARDSLASVLVAVGSFAPLAPAQPGPLQVTFLKIADTDTAVPQGNGTFTGFGGPGTLNLGGPSLHNRNVAFSGRDEADQIGIYRYADLSLSRVADQTTLIPGTTTPFTDLGDSSIEGEDVAFRGYLGSGLSAYKGIFSTVGGLHIVADTDTASPTGSGNFFLLGPPHLFGGQTYYWATTELAAQGVYREFSGAPPEILADTDTLIPSGTGAFTSLTDLHVGANGVVVFGGKGSGGQQGIYRIIGGQTDRLVDVAIAPPNGGTFQTFVGPSVSGNATAFWSYTQPGFVGPGIFLATDPGQVEVVADTSTEVPDSIPPVSFALFESSPSCSDGNIVFGGESAAGTYRGIYGRIGGTLLAIAKRNDPLDGRFISRLALSSDGFDGHRLAVGIAFTDDTPAIYLLTLTRRFDFNLDGLVDEQELLELQTCLEGPESAIGPFPPDTTERYLRTFDVDEDDDVDLRDAAALLNHFAP